MTPPKGSRRELRRAPLPQSFGEAGASTPTVHQCRQIRGFHPGTPRAEKRCLWSSTDYYEPQRTSGVAFTRQRSLVRTHHHLPRDETETLRPRERRRSPPEE